MRLYIYIHLLLVVCNNAYGLEQDVKKYIEKIKPIKWSQKLADSIVRNCDSRDVFSAVRIAFMESSFRNVASDTGDFGVFQINEVHGAVGEWSLDKQTGYACKLIRKAKERGSIGYYHSSTPKFRFLYERKYRNLVDRFPDPL